MPISTVLRQACCLLRLPRHRQGPLYDPPFPVNERFGPGRMIAHSVDVVVFLLQNRRASLQLD